MLNGSLIARDGTGRLRNTVANPTNFNGGTPITVVGGVNLLSAANAVPDVFHQGAPYLNSGVLCTTSVGSVGGFSQGGLPITATGDQVVVDGAGAIDYYNAGLPYTAANKLAIAAPE